MVAFIAIGTHNWQTTAQGQRGTGSWSASLCTLRVRAREGFTPLLARDRCCAPPHRALLCRAPMGISAHGLPRSPLQTPRRGVCRGERDNPCARKSLLVGTCIHLAQAHLRYAWGTYWSPVCRSSPVSIKAVPWEMATLSAPRGVLGERSRLFPQASAVGIVVLPLARAPCGGKV